MVCFFLSLLKRKLPQACPKRVGGGGVKATFGQCPKVSGFFLGMSSLTHLGVITENILIINVFTQVLFMIFVIVNCSVLTLLYCSHLPFPPFSSLPCFSRMVQDAVWWCVIQCAGQVGLEDSIGQDILS